MTITVIFFNTLQDVEAGRKWNIAYLVNSSTAFEPYPRCNNKHEKWIYKNGDSNPAETTQFPMLKQTYSYSSWMGSNPYNASTWKTREVGFLKLLTEFPWYLVSKRLIAII